MKGCVMSKKDLKTYRHAMNVIEGKLSLAEFALLIGKSYRQAHRIVKKTKDRAELGCIHGNVGQVPANKTCWQLMGDVYGELVVRRNREFKKIRDSRYKKAQGVEIICRLLIRHRQANIPSCF